MLKTLESSLRDGGVHGIVYACGFVMIMFIVCGIIVQNIPKKEKFLQNRFMKKILSFFLVKFIIILFLFRYTSSKDLIPVGLTAEHITLQLESLATDYHAFYLQTLRSENAQIIQLSQAGYAAMLGYGHFIREIPSDKVLRNLLSAQYYKTVSFNDFLIRGFTDPALRKLLMRNTDPLMIAAAQKQVATQQLQQFRQLKKNINKTVLSSMPQSSGSIPFRDSAMILLNRLFDWMSKTIHNVVREQATKPISVPRAVLYGTAQINRRMSIYTTMTEKLGIFTKDFIIFHKDMFDNIVSFLRALGISIFITSGGIRLIIPEDVITSPIEIILQIGYILVRAKRLYLQIRPHHWKPAHELTMA